jgi:hypothetical protein
MPIVLVAVALLVCGSTPARAQSGQHDAATATVSGAVLDPSGAPVGGAQVTLTLTDGSRLQTLTSDTDGAFTFSGVSRGSYVIVVEAVGFATVTTTEFTIATADGVRLPPIRLSLPAFTASVLVKPTELIAAEQVKAQEKQRLLGVIPNFFVSYVPDAAPMSSNQKLSLALHETFDWTSFAGTSAVAGVQQATNAYAGFGGGASGYAKRWAAAFATQQSNELLSHYVFASLFHQDPRYFYQGTGSTRSRMFHALSNAFVARSDRGGTMPNYAYLLGDIGASALSNTYYPSADRGAGLVLTNALLGLAGRAGQGLLQEFVFNRVTRHVPPSSANAAPAR